MNKIKNILVILLLFGLTLVAPGCYIANTLRAKDILNEGVREFNKGKYEKAEAMFTRALELSPDLANADFYRAMAVYQQFKELKMSDETAGKVENEFKRTNEAFDHVIEKYKGNPDIIDRSFAFKADVYDYMAKLIAGRDQARADQLKADRLDILLQRAQQEKASDRTKAGVYYALGKNYWDQAFVITEPYSKPPGLELKEKIPADKLNVLKPMVEKARVYFQKAVEAMPEWADAHSMMRLTHVQEIYVLESSDGDAQTKQALADAFDKEGKLAEQYKDSEQSSLMKAK